MKRGGERYDAIVIGSGMGGLTCASLLAQLRGFKVLVLERHYTLGGYTHAFARSGGRRWDVGLHYVGQMEKGGTPRALMDMVTGDRVDWRRMPSPFERFHYPDFTIDQPANAREYLDALLDRWPEERDGLENYFKDIRKAARWLAPYLLSRGGPGWVRWPANVLRHLNRRLPLQTTKEVLDSMIRSPELKAVLASQWGDYGLPPGESAFAAHATIVSHYLDGGWFPEGGSSGIATGAGAMVEAAGGRCLTRQRVESLLIEGGRAVGVRVTRPRGGRDELVEFRAPLVISNVGARATFERLLEGESSPPIEVIRADLRGLPAPCSAVQLFLGLRSSPESLGFRGENHWIFDGYDHDELYGRRNKLLKGEVAVAYVSFPSLKDPTARSHSAEIISFLDYEQVAEWAQQGCNKRDGSYQSLKDKMTEALLRFVERRHPGFAALVDHSELGTPLTFEHFTGHPHGAIYGLPPVPQRYALKWLGVTTPVPGLLLTGSDVTGHGIVGAMMGGVGAAAHALGGAGFFRIMAAALRSRRRRS